MVNFLKSKAERFDAYCKITGTFSRGKGDDFSVSFSCPLAYKEWLSDETSHWFILGVTSAFVLREDYRHPFPVSETLRRNMQFLVAQWCMSYPRTRQIAIEAPLKEDAAASSDMTACLFTGGVDSSFSLLKNRTGIDALLSAEFVFSDEELDALYRNLDFFKAESATIDLERIVIGTDVLRPFAEFGDAWAYLTHAAALAAMAHAFSGRIGRVIISASQEFGHLTSWGSHPLTDPLFSSPALQVEHFGTTYSRYEKVEAIAHAPDIVAGLRVCGRLREELEGRPNCSKCQKCLRTMAALDAAGVDRDQARSFDWSEYSLTALARTPLRHPSEFMFFEELARGDDPKIRRSARTAIRRSAKYKPIVRLENAVRRRFTSVSRYPVLKRIKRKLYGR